jgi:RHS repeat-associated protein
MRNLYYSRQWQVLEEKEASITRRQYVWSPFYIDTPVLRDFDADGYGALEERLYTLHDANANVTSLVSATGVVVERFVYEPFGAFAVRTPTWSARSDSLYGWMYLHQGGRYDGLSGLHHFRNRDYNPGLGMWVRPDPKGYADGLNRYEYERTAPLNRVDPMGLKCSPRAAFIYKNDVSDYNVLHNYEGWNTHLIYGFDTKGSELLCQAWIHIHVHASGGQNWFGLPSLWQEVHIPAADGNHIVKAKCVELANPKGDARWQLVVNAGSYPAQRQKGMVTVGLDIDVTYINEERALVQIVMAAQVAASGAGITAIEAGPAGIQWATNAQLQYSRNADYEIACVC